MARIEWSAKMTVGVPEIDRQHQQLLELFNGLEEGLVAGVGAVVTACQRVGIRSQVQRLSRPHRGDRRTRRRRRGQRQGEGVVNGEGAMAANGSEPLPEENEAGAMEPMNGSVAIPAPLESSPESE